MESEDLSIAAPELVTPAPEAPAETTADEPERIPGPEEALAEEREGEAPPEIDEIEIDWDDGKKYNLPKAHEGGLLRNKDYTQQRQADSEAAKAKAKELESRESEITQRLQATEEELDTRAQLRHVNTEIERFKDFGWAQYQEALRVDPLGAQEAWAYAQNLRAQKSELEDQLSTAQTKRTEAAQQSFAKRVQETLEAAPSIIPGWTPETANKTLGELATFATSEIGIPEQFVKDHWGPQFLKLLHRAQIGHNLMTKQAAVPKPPMPSPQPLETVAGKSAPVTSGDLASMSMEAYVAARKKGIGGKPLR